MCSRYKSRRIQRQMVRSDLAIYMSLRLFVNTDSKNTLCFPKDTPNRKERDSFIVTSDKIHPAPNSLLLVKSHGCGYERKTHKSQLD